MPKRTDRRRVVGNELEGIDLGDERRARRALVIGERLAGTPEASLPAAMGDRAAVEGLYRHLAGEEVTLGAIFEPHVTKTVSRVRARKTVYAVADSTNFVFEGDAVRSGLGIVSGGDQGFLAHVTLAVGPDRTPLGVLGIETWTRPKAKGKSDLQSRRADGQRESLRWGRGMKQARERLGQDASKLVHVADRDGDIYELLAELVQEKQRFIIRAAQDRAVVPLDKQDEAFLFDDAPVHANRLRPRCAALGARPASHSSSQKIHPARRERTARLSFAARPVTLKRPENCFANLISEIDVNVVHVFELCPPPGEPGVE